MSWTYIKKLLLNLNVKFRLVGFKAEEIFCMIKKGLHVNLMLANII